MKRIELIAFLEELHDALSIGRDAAYEIATEFHAAMKGYRELEHVQLDCDVRVIDDAISKVEKQIREIG
jgi:hypothetical protein